MEKYIISILSIYLIFGLFLFFFQRKIVFNVSGFLKSPLYYGLKNVEKIYISTKDNIDFLSWYSKPKNNKPTLVYFHGNSFDIGERSYRIERYIKNGWGYFSWLLEDIVGTKESLVKKIYI